MGITVIIIIITTILWSKIISATELLCACDQDNRPWSWQKTQVFPFSSKLVLSFYKFFQKIWIKTFSVSLLLLGTQQGHLCPRRSSISMCQRKLGVEIIPMGWRGWFVKWLWWWWLIIIMTKLCHQIVIMEYLDNSHDDNETVSLIVMLSMRHNISSSLSG